MNVMFDIGRFVIVDACCHHIILFTVIILYFP
jgi:hypothetical protein